MAQTLAESFLADLDELSDDEPIQEQQEQDEKPDAEDEVCALAFAQLLLG